MRYGCSDTVKTSQYRERKLVHFCRKACENPLSTMEDGRLRIRCCLLYMIDVSKWCIHCIIEKLYSCLRTHQYSYFHKNIWIHCTFRQGYTPELTQEALYEHMKQHIQRDERTGHSNLRQCLLCFRDFLMEDGESNGEYEEDRVDDRDWFLEYFEADRDYPGYHDYNINWECSIKNPNYCIGCKIERHRERFSKTNKRKTRKIIPARKKLIHTLDVPAIDVREYWSGSSTSSSVSSSAGGFN